mgnify:CR=1 FL=1
MPDQYTINAETPYGSTFTGTASKKDMTKWIIIAVVALIVLCCCSISSSLSSGLGYKWMNPTPKA